MDTRRWVDSFSEVHRIAFESCEEFIIERMFGVVGASIDRIGAEVGPVGEVEFEESVPSDGSVRLLDTGWTQDELVGVSIDDPPFPRQGFRDAIEVVFRPVQLVSEAEFIDRLGS